jgi:glycosyltransferase involved in cell wall biosynthesis
VASARLVQTEIATGAGVLCVSIAPEKRYALKPVVLAIPGTFAPAADIINLGETFGILGSLSVVTLPGGEDPLLAAGGLAAVSRAVSEVIETTFAGRCVVLLGVSLGAIVAFGVRARNLTRVVAVEPLLATGKLWPLVAPLRQHFAQTNNAAAEAFSLAAYGIDRTRFEGRDHRSSLDGLDVPVDVILGETPLTPERTLDRFPSLVGEEERRWLASRPGVKLHQIPATGHNVLGQAPNAVRDIVLEACRRGSVGMAPERRGLDEPLLEATPLTAKNVLHWGPGGPAFGAAFGSANPRCRIVVGGPGPADIPQAGPAGGFDAVVLGASPSAEVLGRLAQRLRAGGHLIARDLDRSPLAELGLKLCEPVDTGVPGVLRAQKLEVGRPGRGSLHLKTVVYSGLLMDIRTRLPSRGLRSDPELQVVLDRAPFQLPSLDRDAPKIVVLQRPAELNPQTWRRFMSRAVREGWIVVMEYDDYPPLVAEVQGRASSEADLLRFGYVHAVQTSSPPLLALFRPYNPETVLFENAAFALASFPQDARPRRVFYGGVIRGRYAVEVARSLAPAIERSPETEFVVIGDAEVFKALPTQSKRYYEYMTYEAYLDLMRQCCVSLSPIEALPLRETKSDAKFLDASQLGALTIASPTIYDRVIRHGVNGLLAPDVADWAPLLDRALTDEPWRNGLARRAWEYVRDERMFANQVAQRRDWYWDLWSRRQELNEAVMQRLPGLREDVGA